MVIFARRWLRATAVLLCLLLAAAAVSAASPSESLWTDIDDGAIVRTEQSPRLLPSAYRTLQLDRDGLAALLATAPMEGQVLAEASPVRLSLPLPGGGYGEFAIVESPIMEPGLAARFPEIRTWLGQGIDERSATLRMDLTPQGFHAQIISWEGTTYIDPFQSGDTAHYISYRKRDAQEDGPRMVCQVTGQELPKDAPNFQKRGVAVKVSSGTSLRTYRAAVAATGEYTAFHGGTVAGGLAAIVTTMNRVNGIYERDLAVRMVLIANNNLLIYTNAGTDPYTNNNGSAMLGENQTNITNVIGAANYDIGHVVSTGGGGIAGLGVVCNNNAKARGVTGSSSPIGDPFDVDYVAHEIGHQFAGNHTFNSTNGACGGGNRNAGTAYEVGSGITIQAYAGICGADNVQVNSSDYFHRISLNEMLAFTTNPATGASCGTATATGNQPPTVSTATGFTIPARTPFALSATGSDPNGDALTYLWEQFDLGAAVSGALVDNGASPIFRNYNPVTSPVRTFPALASILSGANGNQWELLPTTNRTLNFRVTARDNRAGGGGTNEASTALTVVNTGAPFAVTAPNTAVTWNAAQTQTVTWDVAGTNANGINAATVRILLSLDGGNTFPLLLASGEANDGSATVNLFGATPTTQARIKVEGENNIFFDISNVNFTITGTGLPTAVFVQSGGNTAVTEGGTTDSYTVALSSAPASNVTITLTADAQLTRSPASLTFTPTNWATPQTVTVTAVDDAVFEGLHTGTISHVANGGGHTNTNFGTITAAITDNDANLSFVSAAVTSGNNAIEPNECNDVTVTLANNGAGAATAVSAVLSSSTPNITISQPNAAFPDIPLGQSRTSSTAFQVSSAAGLVCPGTLAFTLTVNYAGGGSAVIPFTLLGGVSAQNYTFTSSTGATIPAGGTLVPGTQADDAVADLVVPAGFNFSVYGTPVSGGSVLRASTNGNLQFAASGGSAAYANGALPNAGTANNLGAFPASAPVLFAYWDDLDTATAAVTGGGIYQQLTGTAPNRKWIVEWRGEHVSQGTTTITVKFAMEFSENSDSFAYLYETATGGAGAGGASATIGVQSATTGTRFTQHSLNTAVVSTGLRLTAARTTTCTAGTGPCSSGTPGVTVVQSGGTTAVIEGGAGDSYTVVLNAQPTATVTVTVTPDAQVAASPTSLQFTTTNWNTPQAVTVNAVNDAIAEGAHSGTITMSASGGGYTGVSIAPVTVQITDNDTAGITVNPTAGLVTTEAGGTASFTVVLTSQPTANVTLGVASNDASEGTAAPASLTFTAANWNQAQTVTVTGVDDAIDDGNIAYSIITAAATSSDPLYAGINPPDVAVSNTDNDTAGITVNPTAGLITTEAGGTASFTVVLASQPTANVSLGISSSDTTEGTAAPASLTFTSANWNVAQTVTVTGVDDAIDDGNIAYSIVTAAATSSDPLYAGINPPDVAVSNTDNDTAGITVNPTTGLVTTEAGGTASFTVVLASQPTANVSLGISSSDTTEGTAAPASLTFTSANWNVAQTVTVTGVDDAIDDGNIAYSIVTAAATSSDPLYAGINPPDVAVSNTDNDTAGVVVTESGGGTAVTEGSTTDSYTVVLSSEPTADVTIAITTGTQFSVSPGSLIFTPANWNVARTVTVSAVDDNVVEGPQTGPLSHAASSADPAYNGIAVAGFTVSITDNDSAVVNFAPASVSQSEATSPMVFTVTLSNPVASGVTLTVNSTPGTATAADFTAVTGATVSFAANSTTAQTVNVTIANDVLDEDNETFTLTLSGLTATGNVTLGTATATGTIQDDDATPTLSITNPSQDEGNAGPTPMNFVVSLSAVSGRNVSFTRATADGTATVANNDYVAVPAGSVTIPAGQNSVTIPVTINGDTTFEGNETFALNLTGITNATPGTLTGTGTIREDDQQPTTTVITGRTPTSTVVGQAYTVAVTVTGQATSPTGSVTVSDGSASCSAPLTTGTAPASSMSCSLTSTTAGTKTLTASYTASTTAFANSSGTASHVVSPAATTISVTGPARSRINQPTSFSFALAVTAPGAGTPSGTVTLTSGSASCTATLPATSCNLTFTALGNRTVTASYAGDGNFAASTSSALPTLVFALSDVSVTKTDGLATYQPGGLIVYTVQVRNTGPDAAAQVRVQDNVPAGLSAATWTCEASGGAVCSPANGTGSIDMMLASLPVGSLVTYTFQGTVSGAPEQIVNTATLTLPADTTVEDPNAGNNSATDINVLESLFANGFEAPLVNGPEGSTRLPTAALAPVLDEVARAVFKLDDKRGEMARVYARLHLGAVEYALATRGADGRWTLAPWSGYAVDPTLSWNAELSAGTWQLTRVELR